MVKKEARIEMRVSPVEKRQVEIRAKQAGLTVSEWMRRRCLMDMPVEKPKVAT